MKLKPLIAGLVLAGLATGVANAESLRISLAAGAKGAPTGTVRYTLTNPGKADLLVLAWETPLRGVQDDLFDVRGADGAAEYVGRQYKRGLPQPEDYLTIKAGESLSVDVDLTAYYAMPKSGLYDVQAIAHFHDSFQVRPLHGGGEDLKAMSDRDQRSPIVSLFVQGSGAAPQDAYGVLDLAKAGSVSFVGCSTSRQSQINSGVSAAKTMAASATAYLNAGKTGTRYTTWFRAYTASNYSKVKANFGKIADALNNKALQFHCDCTDSAYAWVYPTQPYKIHLCNAFWSAPTAGTDSKGGTTIHELSHFDIVANTDDIAYGQTACKRLSAANAVRNADSHEYFGENTPALN